MQEPIDLIIVGAGVAGLQALNECLKMGVTAKCLERDAMPGGRKYCWTPKHTPEHTPESNRSLMWLLLEYPLPHEPSVRFGASGKWSGHGIYDCVQIQQHKEDFYLPGVPWPEETPSFATRDDMVSATDQYIAANALEAHIECRSKVISTVFDKAAGLWTTKTGAGTTWKSRYIAFAVGTLGPPNTPRQVVEALKHFKGDVVHSHGYYRPLAYEGMDVVVLGYGASSVEIAQDLARNGRCSSVRLVAPPKVQADGMRRGQDWCLSRVLPGMGSRFCSQGQPAGPGEDGSLEARNDLVRTAMKERHPKYPECMPELLRPSDKLEGKPIYPGADGRPLGGRVIVSEGFLDCVSDGKITCYPGYLGTSTKDSVTVVHKGQKDVRLKADAVVVCTGYHPPTGRIAAAMKPSPKDCETLWKGLWMPDVPNAALIGHVYGFVAVPPFAGMQAKFLARVVSGSEPLPPLEDMQRWVADVEDRYTVTQRLTENQYFAELRGANLGRDAFQQAPVGPGPPPEPPKPSLARAAKPMVVAAAAALAASTVVTAALGASPRSGTAVATAAAAAVLAASIVAGGRATLPAKVLRLADDSVAVAAGEALTFLDESQNGDELGGRDLTGEIRVLAVGSRGADVQAALEARLRSSERARVRNFGPVPSVDGPWVGVPSRSMDLVICNGELGAAAPSASFATEALRVLRPGGHAVVMLLEGTPSTAQWLGLFDAHEKPSAKGGQWRLVHKTAPRAHAKGGAYRQYVYRAR